MSLHRLADFLEATADELTMRYEGHGMLSP